MGSPRYLTTVELFTQGGLLRSHGSLCHLAVSVSLGSHEFMSEWLLKLLGRDVRTTLLVADR